MANQYGNWNVNSTKTRWTHKNNPNLTVLIRLFNKYAKDKNAPKYVVFHDHPGPKGRVIGQPLDYAKNMVEARKYATKHLKHWDNPWQWASDPDFGKRGKQG